MSTFTKEQKKVEPYLRAEATVMAVDGLSKMTAVAGLYASYNHFFSISETAKIYAQAQMGVEVAKEYEAQMLAGQEL